MSAAEGPEVSLSGTPDETTLGGLAIRAQRGEHGLVLTLRGELDLASAPLLERRLADAAAAAAGRVVVDLAGLRFIGSTGLRVLLCGQRRLLEHGGELSLRRGPSAVHRVFELTHTDTIFAFED